MDDFDKIYGVAMKKASSMDSKYIKLLEFERKEIDKQGAEQYWVDLIKSKKKFKTNKNALILPFLLKMTNIDPVTANISARLNGKLDIISDPGAFKDKDQPDIDLDFIPDAKDEIRQYANEKYGIDKVCGVGSWQTYKPRSSLKDVAKSLGYQDKLIGIEEMTKNLPDEFDIVTMDVALKDYPDFKEWYDKDDDNKRISKYAFRLVGKAKAQGQHAGGLIISNVPLHEHLPIAKIGAKGKERWTSEWTEGKNVQLSKFGFVKYDILGLKTLQYIHEASKLIERNHGVKIDWDNIGYNDEESFKTANELKTDSVFQLDTDVAKGILSKGGVKKLTDILVYTSLGRPGPMPMVDEYIARRDAVDNDWRQNEHPKVLALLEDTLGICVFQEQVSTLLTELAGFTLPEAERARKIMSKKWKEQMVWVREKILKGMGRTLQGPCPLPKTEIEKDDIERIQAEKEVDEICEVTEWTWAKEYWKRLETFARYSFCKAHAVAYSIQCYRCLYLKTHYPSEWWCAVLNACNRKKQPKYIRMGKSEGVQFGSLDANHLSIKFDVIDGKVVAGLLGVKGIGVKMVEKIDTSIHDIQDIDDFVKRQINNKIFMERVIHLGAFDKIHSNRKALWYWYLFKHGSTDAAVEIREKINSEFKLTPEQMEERKEQMYLEYKKQYPKSKKVPKRILNTAFKPNPTRDQVMGLIKEDYTYEEKLKFQKDFLDYHWDSPMEVYGYRGDCRIEDAKRHGVLECVVSTCESRRSTKGTKFLTLTITDGIDYSKIQVWSNDIDKYGEEYFQQGVGLSMKVSYNHTYKSFNLKKDEPIIKLPKQAEWQKLQEYMADMEVFPEADLEDDLSGDIE